MFVTVSTNRSKRNLEKKRKSLQKEKGNKPTNKHNENKNNKELHVKPAAKLSFARFR